MVTAADVTVNDAEFAYLKVQKGRLEPLANDRKAWLDAYRFTLDATYQGLKPHLPQHCKALLDVGSGLGGIDILLSRHYGHATNVFLLDGERDAPVMELHAQTFNDMVVAHDFLQRHGVNRFGYYTPALGAPRPFDLVVSFGSWCFHYAPTTYLDFVRACCHADTVMIIDVRRDKPAWAHELQGALRLTAVLHIAEKFDRMVFRGTA